MSSKEQSFAFNKEHAAAYDKRFEKMAPLKDLMHLLVQIVLNKLPEEANILSVGAGTGAEVIYLAQIFPKWRFTTVEPSGPMLDICRQRAEETGITSRCIFHEGYLDSLPESEPFDAATSLLVSHFIMKQEDRIEYFSQISKRLKPGGYLMSSDLAADMSTPEYESLIQVWLRMLQYSDMPADKVDEYVSVLGKQVALLPPQTVESIIKAGGFDLPVQFYQALLIRGWYARRSQ